MSAIKRQLPGKRGFGECSARMALLVMLSLLVGCGKAPSDEPKDANDGANSPSNQQKIPQPEPVSKAAVNEEGTAASSDSERSESSDSVSVAVPTGPAIACVSYNLPLERVSSTAIAIDEYIGDDGTATTLWLMKKPSIEGASDIKYSLWFDHLGVESKTREWIRAAVFLRIPETNLLILSTRGVSHVCADRSGEEPKTNLLVLMPNFIYVGMGRLDLNPTTAIVPENFDVETGSIDLHANMPSGDGKSVELRDELLPLVTEDGELIGAVVKEVEKGWRIEKLPAVGSFVDPVLGPFEVTAEVQTLGAVKIECRGLYSRRLKQNGQFLCVLGLEKDALSGLDEEGRRYLTDLNSPLKGQLESSGFHSDSNSPATGSLNFNFRFPLDAEEISLVGQLLWKPRDGRAVPYPPFEVKLSLGDRPSLWVSEHGMFKARLEPGVPAPSSSNRYVANAQVVELPSEMLPNQVALTADGLVMALHESPQLQTFSSKSGKLDALPSTLEGEKLLIGADENHVFIMDTSGGIIEKWHLPSRKLVASGQVSQPGEVLALAPLEARPGSFVVLLCKDRFRFISQDSFNERFPAVSADWSNSDLFDGYRLAESELLIASEAIASTSAQGNAVLFRVRYQTADETARRVPISLIVSQGKLPGMLDISGYAGPLPSLGAFGHTYFSGERLQQIRLENNFKNPVWTGVFAKSDSIEWGGAYSGKDGMDLVLSSQRKARQLPPLPFELRISSRNRHRNGKSTETVRRPPPTSGSGETNVQPKNSSSVSLGKFPELAGFGTRLTGGFRVLSKHLFFTPEEDLLLTFSSDGKKLFSRKLNTQDIIDELSSGGFEISGSVPLRIWRGQQIRCRFSTSTKTKTKFSLLKGPSGAEITSAGVLTWTCPEEFLNESAVFRISARDPESTNSIEKVVEVNVKGAPAALHFLPDGSSQGGAIPLRIIEVPGGGEVVEKIEAGSGRFHLILSEHPGEKFRLEVFDAEDESWLEGLELPSRPDVFTANSKIVYLVYNEQNLMELRSLSELSRSKSVHLNLPIAGLGCSPDTTEGVLCIVEDLDPEKLKVAEFIDWNGRKLTVTKSLGPDKRFVFLSPTTLKPLGIGGAEEDLREIVSAFPDGKDGRAHRLAFSPNGKKMVLPRYIVDFASKVGVFELASAWQVTFNPLAFSDDANIVYPVEGRLRTEYSNEFEYGRRKYLPVETNFFTGAAVRPLSGRDIDVGVGKDFRNPDSPHFAMFRTRGSDQLLKIVKPLPELSEFLDPDRRDFRNRRATMYQNKLITIGHQFHQLLIRDIDLP